MKNLNLIDLGHKDHKLGKISALYIFRKIDPKQFTKDWIEGITKFFNNINS